LKLQSKSNEKTVPLAKGSCIESQEHILSVSRDGCECRSQFINDIIGGVYN
jgi:hypothetical protein